MKRIALVTAIAMMLGQHAFAAGTWNKSTAQAQQKAKAKNEHIFVDLFADWCGWCHRFEQEVIPSQPFQSATDKMVLLRLNTEDNGDGTAFAREFAISTLPTFLILAPDMSVVGIIHGYQPPAEFAASVKDPEGRYADFQKRAGNEQAIASNFPQRLELAREYRAHFSFDKAEPRFRTLTTERGVPSAVRDEAYYELALTQMMEHKFDDSLATVKRFTAVASKGDSFERARVLVGDVYLQQGKLPLAAAEYKKFKKDFPNSPLNRNIDYILPQIERQMGSK